MNKNCGDFSAEQIAALAKSPAGQQLFAMLQNADSQKLAQAANQANAGNYDAAQNTLQSLLADPKIRALVQQLGGK